MANNVIGSMIVNLGLETGRLKSDTDRASRHFNSFEKKAGRALKKVGSRVANLTKTMGIMSGVAATMAIVGLGKVTTSAIDASDEIGKMADQIGASTEALSEYQHVAALSGVEFNTLTKSFRFMQNQVSDATKGIGDGQKALEELGLSAERLNQLKPEDQFEAIAKAFDGVTVASDRTRLAMDLFGGRGVSLLQTLKGGSKGLQEMRAEARLLGLSLSRADVDGAARANDSMLKLTTTVSALGITVGKELQGPIGDIADTLTAAALASGGFKTEIRSGVKAGLGALSTFAESTEKVVNYFDDRPYLASAGILGYMIYGKAGVAAVAGFTLAADKVRGIVDDMAGRFLSTADNSSIEKARKELIALEEKYTAAVMFGFDGRAIAAQKEIDLQKISIAQMELMTGVSGGTAGNIEESAGWAGALGDALRRAQQSMDVISEVSESSTITTPTLTILEGGMNAAGNTVPFREMPSDLAKLTIETDKTTKSLKGLGTQQERNIRLFADMKLQSQQWAASFSDSLVEGGFNFQNFAIGISKQLQKIALEKAFAPVFGSFATGLTNLFSGSGNLSAAGNTVPFGTLSEELAGGTNFAKGGSTLVGEKGPEIVNMPRGSQVIPNHKIGSGSGNVSVVVNVDASGSSASGDQDGQRLGNMIGIAVRSVLIDESRPGGMLA